MNLTEKQRETLQKYEKHLHSAVYADYIVGLHVEQVRELFAVYNEITGQHKTNYSCNFCVMEVAKELGRWYYTN